MIPHIEVAIVLKLIEAELRTRAWGWVRSEEWGFAVQWVQSFSHAK